jgi:hypothetical protein
MACADAGRVAAGERLRTGVNEPRIEPTLCHAAWPIDRVPGAAVWVEVISRVRGILLTRSGIFGQ